MHAPPTDRAQPQHVYRVLRAAEWRDLQSSNVFKGNAVDQRDGFIHLSTREQLPGTIGRHFAGASDIVIVEIDVTKLGSELRWEASRDGALFPHLYGTLPPSAISRRMVAADLR